MKRVTIIVGTSSKKHTYSAVQQFMEYLQSFGDVECRIITLSDFRLDVCRGCKICFEKGEEDCPLKDDRDVLIEEMMSSDGVIFATPNYSFNVSALMKIFLDRLGFIFHRPCFFGKCFTSIVTQGVYGGDKIVNYLDFVGNGMGFNTVKGQCLTAFEPMTEKEKEKRNNILSIQSRKFYQKLINADYPVPTLLKLMGFRMGRTSMRLELDDTSYDYRHYKDNGWFESDYFYPTRLGLFKKAAGSLFDLIQTRTTGNRLRILHKK
ncbi:MAG: flavodoxin family protein [Spirochaetes bacterium]|nr:flavodoxin family protein [Spirochaetota bacterium]